MNKLPPRYLRREAIKAKWREVKRGGVRVNLAEFTAQFSKAITLDPPKPDRGRFLHRHGRAEAERRRAKDAAMMRRYAEGIDNIADPVRLEDPSSVP